MSAGDKLTHGQPSNRSTRCPPEHVSAYPWRSLQQNGHKKITTVQQVCVHISELQNVIGYTTSWKIMKPKCHFSLLYKQRSVRKVKRNNYLIINPQIPEPKTYLQSTVEHSIGQRNTKLLLTCGCQQACAQRALHELVNVTFVQMFTATKYHLKEETRLTVS